jgi:hypothetical protein
MSLMDLRCAGTFTKEPKGFAVVGIHWGGLEVPRCIFHGGSSYQLLSLRDVDR